MVGQGDITTQDTLGVTPDIPQQEEVSGFFDIQTVPMQDQGLRRQDFKKKPTFGDLIGSAREEFTLDAAVVAAFKAPKFDIDPNFDMSSKVADLRKDLSFEEVKWLQDNTHSEEEFEFNYAKLLNHKANREVISEFSIGQNLAAGFLAVLTQPSTYLIGYGQAKIMANMARTTALSWGAKSGGIGAAIGVGYEVPQFLNNPYSEASDFLYAAALGFTFDAGLSRFYKGKDLPEHVRRVEEANKELTEALNPLNREEFSNVPTYNRADNEITFSVAPLENEYISMGGLDLSDFNQIAKGETSPDIIGKMFNTQPLEKGIAARSNNTLSSYSSKTQSAFKGLEASLNSTLQKLNLPPLKGMFIDSRVKKSHGSYNANQHAIKLNEGVIRDLDNFLNTGQNKDKAIRALETVVHELGHAVVMSTTAAIKQGKLTEDLQRLLRQAHSEWLESTRGQPTSFRQPQSAKELTDNARFLKNNQTYYKSFDEWAADSVAKYLMSNGKVLDNNLPKSFADKILKAIKDVYKKLFKEFGFTNKDYNDRIDQYMKYLGENYNGKINNFVSSDLPEATLKKIAEAGSKAGYRLQSVSAKDKAITDVIVSRGYMVTKDVFEPNSGASQELTIDIIERRLREAKAEKLPENSYQKIIAKIAEKLDYSWTGRIVSRYKGNKHAEYASTFLMASASGINQRGLDADSLKFAYSHKFAGKLVLELQDHYNNWALRNKGNMEFTSENLELHRAEFDVEVFNAMETKYAQWEASTNKQEFDAWWNEHSKSLDPSIAKATETLDDGFKDVLTELKLRNVKGFENIDVHPGYIPHIFDYDAILNIPPSKIDIYEGLVARQFQSLYGLSKSKADKFAKNFMSNAIHRSMGQQSDLTQVLSRGDLEDLKELFQGVDQADLEDFIRLREARESDKGRPTRSKRRIKFDLTDHVEQNGQVYRLSDLYSKNLGAVNAKYALEMSGHLGMARHGILSRADFEKFKRNAMDEQYHLADRKYTPEQLGKDFDDIYNIIMSRPIQGAMNKGIRRFNEFSNLVLFGKSGIPQVAETGAAIGHFGVGRILQASSDFNQLTRDLQTGQLPRKDLAFLETLAGRVGEDHRLFPSVIQRIGEEKSGGSSKFWTGMDRVLGAANKTLWNINLNNVIRSAQQRVVHLAAISDTLDKIRHFDKISNSKKIRLASHGIGAKEVEMFRRNIHHVEFSPNGGVIDVNLDLWDRNAAQTFGFALRKMSNNVIQGHMGTESWPIMYGNIGGLFTKARAYPIIALQKQLMRNLYYGDYQSMAYFMYASLFGGLAYLGMVSTNAAGREDWREYIQDRTEGAKLLAGAPMYTSFTSLFPDAMNVFSATGLMPMQFSPNGIYMDRSGMSQSLTGEALANIIPATGIARNMINATTLPARWALGEDIPTDAVRSIKGSTAYGNWYGTTALFNMADDYLK